MNFILDFWWIICDHLKNWLDVWVWIKLSKNVKQAFWFVDIRVWHLNGAKALTSTLNAGLNRLSGSSGHFGVVRAIFRHAGAYSRIRFGVEVLVSHQTINDGVHEHPRRAAGMRSRGLHGSRRRSSENPREPNIPSRPSGPGTLRPWGQKNLRLNRPDLW